MDYSNSLKQCEDILSQNSIRKHLNTDLVNKLDIKLYDEVTSTNTLLRTLADNGAKEGTVIVASSQSAGKGRIGRRFFSPASTGIYMSILLRPTLSGEEITFITPATAVATSRAFFTATNKEIKIKWVNDLFLHDKKVCGILTEASVTGNKTDFLIVGIGINVYSPQNGFASEIKNIAGALTDTFESGLRSKITAYILNEFFKIYNNFDNLDFVEEYIGRSCVIGKKIDVIKNGVISQAIALGIDNRCRLTVQYSDGNIENLSSGEISTRLRK